MKEKNKYEFVDFLVISPEKWKEKVLKELNESSPENLQLKSDGIALDPFYTSKDLHKLEYLQLFQAHYALKSPRYWYTREVIPVHDLKKANLKAKAALEMGSNALEFDLSPIPIVETQISALLKDLTTDFFPIHLRTNISPLKISTLFSQEGLEYLKGSLINKEWAGNKDYFKTEITSLAAAIQLMKETAPRYKLINIEAADFRIQNSGPEEIAYSITLALEYIDHLTQAGVPVKDVLTQFEFSFPIGKNYFLEIAKLRCFRFLWKKVTEACSSDFDSFTTPLHCSTSKRYFSSEDVYQNILQNTTEAMAAIIGGCDSLTVVPFDLQEENPFSSRISRNISLILKEESYMDKVVDPSAGSYYIETITDKLIEESWKLIVQIEKQGGFIKSWKKGATH